MWPPAPRRNRPPSRNNPPAPLSWRMATPAGFEPATTRLEGECSIQLSYGAVGGLPETGLAIPGEVMCEPGRSGNYRHSSSASRCSLAAG
jgi:hypothetical protein